MEEVIGILQNANKIWKKILEEWDLSGKYQDCHIIVREGQLILNCPYAGSLHHDGFDSIVDISFMIKKDWDRIELVKTEPKSINERYSQFVKEFEKIY